MKKNLLISLKITALLILLCAVIYPLLIAFIGKAAPGGGAGEKLSHQGKVVGYERIGQSFTDDRYFQGRSSAVNYNSAGSGGSNKGPSNTDYLKIIQDRIDTFLAHNPGISKHEIPSELVTASGSGLDPEITPAAARIQVKRIAAIRGLPESTVSTLVEQHTKTGYLSPSTVHVLKINIALDELK